MDRTQSPSMSVIRSSLRGNASPIVVAIVALLAGACDGGRLISEADTRPTDAMKLHPVSAEVQTASLDVSSVRGGVLGSDAYLDVTRFVREYRRDGRSVLTIEVPRGGSSARMIDQIRYVADANGVGHRRVRVVQRRDGNAGITLKYERIAAIAPECGDWSEDATRRPEIGPYRNFGCASQRNLANMVAYPTDLLFPQVEADRQGDNRSKGYQDFSTGKGGSGNVLSPIQR